MISSFGSKDVEVAVFRFEDEALLLPSSFSVRALAKTREPVLLAQIILFQRKKDQSTYGLNLCMMMMMTLQPALVQVIPPRVLT